jgi:hypothetical protein
MRFEACFAVLLSASICLPLGGKAQGIPKPEAVTFLGVEQFAQSVRRAAVSIHRRDGTNVVPQPLASGFVVKISTDKYVVVTSAHIGISPQIPNLGTASFAVGLLTTNEAVRFAFAVGARVYPEYDVTLLRIGPSHDGSKLTIANNYVTRSEIARGTNIVEGRGLMIVGYPLQQGLEAMAVPSGIAFTNTPVVRLGIVARRPINNHFLIDGTFSPGTSGSLVFDLQQKQVIGLARGFLKEGIELQSKDGNTVAVLPYNSGLGVAVTMDPIINLLVDEGMEP